jgi:hypothetical protein
MLEQAVAEATPLGKDGNPPLTATILSQMCKVIWPDPNLRYVQRYRISTNVEAKASETVPREVSVAATPNGKNGMMKDEIVSEVIGVTDERPPHANVSPSS